MNKSQIKQTIAQIKEFDKEIKNHEEEVKFYKDMKHNAEQELYAALAPIFFSGNPVLKGKANEDLARHVPAILASIEAGSGTTLDQIIEDNFK